MFLLSSLLIVYVSGEYVTDACAVQYEKRWRPHYCLRMINSLQGGGTTAFPYRYWTWNQILDMASGPRGLTKESENSRENSRLVRDMGYWVTATTAWIKSGNAVDRSCLEQNEFIFLCLFDLLTQWLKVATKKKFIKGKFLNQFISNVRLVGRLASFFFFFFSWISTLP